MPDKKVEDEYEELEELISQLSRNVAANERALQELREQYERLKKRVYNEQK